MVPHSIITVSLATAMLPLLSSYAADGNLAAVGSAVSATLRSAYALVVPVAALFARDGAGHRPRDLGLRQRGGRLRQLRAVAGPVRARAGAVHRPLPGAARLLRPRADPPGVLDPVRDRGHQHRRGDRCSPTAPRPPRSPRGWCSPTPAPTRVGAATSYTLLSPGGRRARRSPPGAVPGPARDRRRRSAPASAWGLRRAASDCSTSRASPARRARPRGGRAGVSSAVYLGLARLLRITEVNEVMALVTRRAARQALSRVTGMAVDRGRPGPTMGTGAADRRERRRGRAVRLHPRRAHRGRGVT